MRSQGAEYHQAARGLYHGNLDEANLSPADAQLIAYAEKLTLSPATIDDADIAMLHTAGFSDEQVWEATFTVSIFALFNRMADAYGLIGRDMMIQAIESE